MFDGAKWFVVRDGDERALGLYLRHYSATRARKDLTAHVRGNDAKFVGPGEHMVLMTSCGRGLFVWRRQQYRADDRKGVECVVFRNEGAGLASELITEACELAWQRWPTERLWTFVSPTQIRSTNPGYCFKMAGFTFTETIPKGLHVLERRPPEPPAPQLEEEAEEPRHWCTFAELATLLVDAIEGEDPDWMTAYEWLRDAVRSA